MAIGECNTTVDSRGRELLQHGTVAFPIACYHDDFRKMNVPWHWHEELEAVVISEGSCTVAAGSEKIVLHAGEGFFINSGVLHGAWDNAATGCRFHSLVFHPRLVGGSLDSVYYQSYLQPLLADPSLEIIPLRPEIPWQKGALEAIESAWQQCLREADGYEFQARNALSELIWLLHRNLNAPRRHTSEKSLRDAERIKTMLSFIHGNFASELTTRAIASSAMISESEALRCFRATIGTTPIQYVKQYRIQQAAQLLDTPEKISDIAARCGFQDMSYFTRTFRELKGCTPTEYRQGKA
ncbi:MAG: AraC family transcriptional regulator [Oscillospiraceae bacterium]|nr:AraC family transcriptional regulator [Oscillospiraceae bacterium]